MSFTDDAGTQTLTFTGAGVAPAAPKLVLSPSTYSFGAVAAGSSPIETVTLTNTGDKPANFTYSGTAESDGLQMAAAGVTCQTTLAPGASCNIPVQFTGGDNGAASFLIDITGNSGTNSVAGALIGFGSNASPSPAFIDLGNGFAPNTVTLNGAATVTGGMLQLTANQASQASSAFYPTQVATTSFSTDFAFQLLDPLAEGITFTIQGNDPSAIGSGGGGLGY